MMLERWADPVEIVDSDHDWVDALVDYYAALRMLVEPMLRDPLAARHWKRIDGDLKTPGLLDIEPEPTTVESANDRWRGVVGATFALAEGYYRRQVVAEAARRSRGGAPPA